MKRLIRVGETDYQLLRQTEGFGAGMTMRDPPRLVINIPHHLDLNETLLHELFHAVEHELIRQGRLDKESSEEYVEMVTTMLYQSLVRSGIMKMEVEWEQLNLFQVDPKTGAIT